MTTPNPHTTKDSTDTVTNVGIKGSDELDQLFFNELRGKTVTQDQGSILRWAEARLKPALRIWADKRAASTASSDELPVLAIDPSAIDFYSEAVLPDAPTALRARMRAAIIRGVDAHVATANREVLDAVEREFPKKYDRNMNRMSEPAREYYNAAIDNATAAIQKIREGL